MSTSDPTRTLRQTRELEQRLAVGGHDVEMHKVALIAGLVLAVLGAALVPLPGPGYPVLALGLVVAAAAAMSMRVRNSKRP